MRSGQTAATDLELDWLDDATKAVRSAKPVRQEFAGGGRLHIDRPWTARDQLPLP
jgi:hypothetical protein